MKADRAQGSDPLPKQSCQTARNLYCSAPESLSRAEFNNVGIDPVCSKAQTANRFARSAIIHSTLFYADLAAPVNPGKVSFTCPETLDRESRKIHLPALDVDSEQASQGVPVTRKAGAATPAFFVSARPIRAPLWVCLL
jgi:hypothetical protein